MYKSLYNGYNTKTHTLYICVKILALVISFIGSKCCVPQWLGRKHHISPWLILTSGKRRIMTSAICFHSEEYNILTCTLLIWRQVQYVSIASSDNKSVHIIVVMNSS